MSLESVRARTAARKAAGLVPVYTGRGRAAGPRRLGPRPGPAPPALRQPVCPKCGADFRLEPCGGCRGRVRRKVCDCAAA